MRKLAIALAAALLVPAGVAAARPDDLARETARLLSVAASDDLAEDALYRQIQTWAWPPPRGTRKAPNGNLDGRSRAFLHLGDLGAPFPLDPEDAKLSDAARRVGRYAPLRALRSLRLALRSPDAAVRAQAALALGWARDPGAEPFVVRLLQDPEASVRARAAEALGIMDDREARPALEAALGDPSRTVRIFAARALGHLGDARAIGALEPLVRDRRGADAGGPAYGTPAPVRRAAWEAIARLGGHGSVSILREALGDPAVRYGRLAYSLHRKALPAELRDLAEKGVDDEAIRMLSAAAGEGADAGGLALLAADLSDPDPVLRRAAVSALAAARNPLSTDPLLAALRDHDAQVRGLAAQALAAVGNPRAAEALAGALARGDARIAGIDQAGPAIVRLADPRVLPGLLHLIRGPNPVVAADALLAIGMLGDAEEVQPVTGVLAHPHPQVRSAAARAVADLAAVDPARERFVMCGDWGRAGLLTDRDLAAGPGTARVASGSGAGACGLRTLLELARDPVPAVRMAAVTALGSLGDGRAYGALFDAGLDRDAGVADAARIAIGAVGVRYAADPLGRAARSGSAAAARGLAALGPDAAAVRIAGLLAAPDPATRAQAAGALREYWAFGMGGQDGSADGAAAARLSKALWDADRGVRIQAALALSEFQGSAPAAALRGAVARANPFARVWFAAAAIRQGSAPATQAGGRAGRRAGASGSAADPWLALRGAVAAPDAELRRAALQAVAWMRLPEGAGLAGPAIHDRDPAVRDAAALALARSPGPEGAAQLARLAGGGQWRAAVRALDALDGRDYRVQQLVDAALEHRDIRVRWAGERLAMRAERFDIAIDRDSGLTAD